MGKKGWSGRPGSLRGEGAGKGVRWGWREGGVGEAWPCCVVDVECICSEYPSPSSSPARANRT